MNPQCPFARSGMRTGRMRAIDQRCRFWGRLLRRLRQRSGQEDQERRRNCKRSFQPEPSATRQYHLLASITSGYPAAIEPIADYVVPEEFFVLHGGCPEPR